MKTLQRILPLAAIGALVASAWAHEADNFKLVPSDGALGDAFGSAVSIDGTVALVASPMADGVGADSGAVYVYSFDGVAWNEIAKLTASDAAAGAHFGAAVALNGSRLVVGAPGANGGDGAAYAFSFDGAVWSEDSVLTPAGLAAGAGYGSSVAIDGSSAVIGAPNASAAYVFVDSGGWSQEAALGALGSVPGDRFGAGVTLNGDLIAVGAPNGTGAIANSGTVHTFSRSASLWSEGQTLVLDDPSTGDLFGAALDMYNSIELLVGIPGIDIGATDTGGSQRFRLEGGSWVLKNGYPGRDADDRMGESIALFDRYNVMGVAGDDDEALDAGTTYRYLKNSATPLEVYVGHDAEPDAAFGAAVDISDTWAVNGSPNHSGVGSAYIHSAVQAVVLPLLGSGINPNILTTLSGPVVGQTWESSVDLTLYPDSERTRLIMKRNPAPAPIMSMFGELFFKTSDPVVLMNDALGLHSIFVPGNPALLDREFTLMAVVYGAAVDGFPILALTNGQTVTLGTTDYPVNQEE